MIGSVNRFMGLILYIGNISIAGIAGLITYVVLHEEKQEQIASPIGPTVFITILSYMTASFFTSIFDMAMTTVLQCFAIDEEVNGNFADEDLKTFLSSYSKIDINNNNTEEKLNEKEGEEFDQLGVVEKQEKNLDDEELKEEIENVNQKEKDFETEVADENEFFPESPTE